MYIQVHSRLKSYVEIRCDLCGQRVQLSAMSENKAGKHMREHGWTVVENEGRHRCPQCKYLHTQHNGKMRRPYSNVNVKTEEVKQND